MDQRKLYRLICVLYAVGGAIISVYHIANGNGALALLGPVTWLFLLVPPLGEKLLRLKLGYPLRSQIIVFAFLAFSLGTGMRWHDNLLLFDDFTHFLSGILFAAIGFCIYGRVREKKPADRGEDILLQVTYAFFFSMFVAVLWEIGEYTCYLVTGRDVQHTLTTGVHDTMQDTVSCVLGTMIACADYMYFAGKGKSSFITRTVKSFDEANLQDPGSLRKAAKR